MSDQQTTTEPMKYAPPQLVVYGAVTDITASGSGAMQESRKDGECKDKPKKSKC